MKSVVSSYGINQHELERFKDDVYIVAKIVIKIVLINFFVYHNFL